MIRRPPRSTQSRSSAASDVYKRQSADRAERMFEIGGGAEAIESPSRKLRGDGAFERALVGGAHGLERRRRAPLGLGADLQARGLRLAEANCRQLENAVLD